MVTDDAARKALQNLPNVGPAVAGDLLKLGVRTQFDLQGRSPQALYEKLQEITGQAQDPCVLDTFTALVDYSSGAPARPWWYYSRLRKERNSTT